MSVCRPWQIERSGRIWTPDECRERMDQLAELTIELCRGKLLSSDRARLTLAGCLAENLGADAIVGLGDPKVWLEAIAELGET